MSVKFSETNIGYLFGWITFRISGLIESRKKTPKKIPPEFLINTLYNLIIKSCSSPYSESITSKDNSRGFDFYLIKLFDKYVENKIFESHITPKNYFCYVAINRKLPSGITIENAILTLRDLYNTLYKIPDNPLKNQLLNDIVPSGWVHIREMMKQSLEEFRKNNNKPNNDLFRNWALNFWIIIESQIKDTLGYKNLILGNIDTMIKVLEFLEIYFIASDTAITRTHLNAKRILETISRWSFENPLTNEKIKEFIERLNIILNQDNQTITIPQNGQVSANTHPPANVNAQGTESLPAEQRIKTKD